MTTSDKLILVGEVFLKIAQNFWWVLLLAAVAGIVCRLQESNIRQ